jgi:hypothetical protein
MTVAPARLVRDGSPPAGQIFHAAGPHADGWIIVALHDSTESWETLRDGTPIPAMQSGIESGFRHPRPSERSKCRTSSRVRPRRIAVRTTKPALSGGFRRSGIGTSSERLREP